MINTVVCSVPTNDGHIKGVVAYQGSLSREGLLYVHIIGKIQGGRRGQGARVPISNHVY